MRFSHQPDRPASSLTRRGLLTAGVGAAATAALAGCGSSSGTSKGGSASGSASDKHTLTDSLGRKVELSTRPQRIISLMDWASGMAVLSLGGTLTGMMSRQGNAFMKAVASQYDLSKVAKLGGFDEWNLEQIAALKPDLIFASAWEGKANVGELSVEKLQAIGPTYVLEDGRTTQDEFMRRVGEAIGMQDEVDKQRSAYQKTFAAARTSLAQKAKGLSFADCGWGSPTFWVSTPSSPQPLIKLGLAIGMTLPKAASTPGKKRTDELDLSAEEIMQGSADVMFYPVDEEPTKLPLWPRLPAVKAHQVVAQSFDSIGWTYREYERTLTLLSNALKGARKVTP